MAAYTTLAALVVRYGEGLLVQLTDRADPPVGVVDAAIAEQAIVGASAVADASLAVRYRLPLAAVPTTIEDAVQAIAIYKLHRFVPDEKIKDEYDQALKDLGDIASGRKKLDLAGDEPASSGANGVVAIDRERPLTPETMTGFI